jgi:hypothetical protein
MENYKEKLIEKSEKMMTSLDLYQPMYDTLYIPREVPMYNFFFSIPRGQSALLLNAKGELKATIKNYLYTNMDASNVMITKLLKFDKFIFDFVFPSPSGSLMYQSNDDNQKDMLKFIENAFFQFKVVEMDIFNLPLQCFTQIKPFKWAVQIKVPITINPFETMEATVNVRDGLILKSDFHLILDLDGYIRRPCY